MLKLKSSLDRVSPISLDSTLEDTLNAFNAFQAVGILP